MRTSLLLLCSLLLCASPAYPWGSEAHKAIAEVAKDLLRPEVKERVEKILGDGDLAKASVWLDDVRLAKKYHSGPLQDDPAAQDFNARFPTNDWWHFVDLPVGWTKYSADAFFASKDDIVHAIHHCIEVLEGRASDLSEREALRVLIHLVGDAHAPLHAAAGYYDLSDPEHPKLVSDPADAKTRQHDRGGNQLYYGPSSQLHALWGDEIPDTLSSADAGEPLPRRLLAEAKGQDWRTPGDYHEWAERWVEDSATEAMELYRGLTFGHATLKSDGRIDQIAITLPEQYLEKQPAKVQTRLAKAGVHLADLLNTMHFR